MATKLNVYKKDGQTPVPGFTVKRAQEAAPTNVKSTPTEDGATVTAG